MKTVVLRIVVSNTVFFVVFVRSGDPSLTRKPKGKEGHDIKREGGGGIFNPPIPPN